MENKLNQAAIESYSVKLTKKLSDDFFQKNLVISGSQILKFTPIEQINLFVISNLFDKWKEETSKLKSPYFDFENADVKSALRTFMNVLSKHIAIRRSDFDPLLRNAIANTLCLSLAPYLFMKENYFSFETPVIQMTEFKDRVKFLRLNKNISDAFIKRIEKHNLTSTPLSYALDYLNESYKEVSNELENPEGLVLEINKLEPITIEQLVFSYRPAPTKTPIIENNITLEAPIVEESIVEETPIIQNEVLPVIEKVELVEEKQIEIEKPIIQDVIVEEPKVEAPIIAPIAFEEPVKQTYIEEPIIEEPIIQNIVSEIVIENKIETIAEPIIQAQVEPVKEEIPQVKITPKVQLKVEEPKAPTIKKQTVLDRAHQNKLTDLKSAITINQRFMFVNELFKGESKMFQEALEKIDVCLSYKEAIDMLLDNYASKYDWDTDKSEVSEFFELVSRKFISE